MAEEAIRAAAIASIKTAMQDGNKKQAKLVASLFRPEPKARFEDNIVYGQMMILVQDWAKAIKPLEAALKQRPDRQAAANLETARWMLSTREDLRGMRAGAALSYLLDQDNISTVMDVGSGGGEHALIFAQAGKTVHCVDLGKSVYVQRSKVSDELAAQESVTFSQVNFMDLDDTGSYDLVWCSHVLEHQPNANAFLKKALMAVKPDGWLAVTVPPLKHMIVGGHVSLWNAGLMLYQIILAGNDCSKAVVMNYGYNISVLVRRKSILLPDLDYDHGDIDRLASYFPAGCSEPFDGRMIGFQHASDAEGSEHISENVLPVTAVPQFPPDA